MRNRYNVIIACILILLTTAIIPAVSTPSRELLPPPPENVTVTPQDQMIKLDWDFPLGFTGNDLVGFSVLKGPDPGSVTNIIASLGPFVQTYTDVSVVNGQTYYYSIKSINDTGSSDPTTPISAIPRGPAFAPRNFTSSYESETIHLNWKAPSDVNGSPITFYSVFKGMDDDHIDIRTNVSMDTTFTDHGLMNGVAYYYQVCAVTAAGDGKKTNVKMITPRTVPTAPYNLTSQKGDSEVILRWNLSEKDGGALIQGHKIYRGIDVSSMEHVASIGTENTYTDRELENGQSYYFSVTAFNSEGESDLASATTEIPLGPPGRPLNMTLGPGNLEVTISWEAPEEDGGTPILGYRIYFNKHGEEMALGGDAGDVLEYTLTELENNQIYYFQVRAYNTEGEGPGSTTDLIRPEPLPKIPENFRIIDLEGQVKLAWTKPSYSGEYSYDEVIIYRGPSEDNLELFKNLSYEQNQFYDEDVVVGSVYYYEMTIVSRIGEGLATPTLVGRPFGRPTVPLNFNVEPDIGSAQLTWDQPTFFGGRVIEGFKVFRGTERETLTVVATVVGMQTFYNDTNLKNGNTYYYRISAFNVELEGNSTEIVEIIPKGPPLDPKNSVGVLDPKNGTVVITWTDPTSNGGTEISSYRIYRGLERDNLTFIMELEPGVEFVDEGVEPGVGYYYSITAVNEKGEGPSSMVIFVQIPVEESSSDPGGNAVTWIVLALVVIFIMVIIVIIAVVQSNKKKKELEEKETDIPILEESDSEREERLIRERREMMSQYTDVPISTIDAHAGDHEEHHLSYDDLYGSKANTENAGPPQPVDGSSNVETTPPLQYTQPAQAEMQTQPAADTPQYQPPQDSTS